MAIQKPGIPKGTRDFSPQETAGRNYIFKTVQDVFHLFGFQSIETPAMENLSTLMGKYGEEGDRLIFRILNSGDFLSKVNDTDLNNKDSLKLSSQISEKALRYDLTVPFARYVVQYQNEITFPFRRYQIQAVWRADRPQKGRYREFYQCDVDMIGSNSLLNETELVQIIDMVFNKLGIRVAVKINNRKILAGIADLIGAPEMIVPITVAIDKLDKIGLDGVIAELKEKQLSNSAIDALLPVLNLSGNFQEKLDQLSLILKESETGMKGVEEMITLKGLLDAVSFNCEIELDLTLARGLNYYTGAIFEVKALDVAMGSICGGGRYDDLTGIFGLKGMSGVGVSFGADRIYDVLNELSLFPEQAGHFTTVLFANFGDKELKYCMALADACRKEGIGCEIYPDNTKMKKQLGYADDKKIPYVALVGEQEMASGLIGLKKLATGEQKTVSLQQMISELKTNN